MMLSIILSATLLIADLAVSSVINRSLVDCLSKCYYIIGWWHYLLIASSALLLLPTMLSVTPDSFKFLAFLSCASILIVGSAADYKGNANTIHQVASYTCAVCALLWSMLVCPIALLAMLISQIGWIDKERNLLWCEIGAFATVYCSVIAITGTMIN